MSVFFISFSICCISVFSNIKRQVKSKSVLHTIIIAQYTCSNLLVASTPGLSGLTYVFLLFENTNVKISLTQIANCTHVYAVFVLVLVCFTLYSFKYRHIITVIITNLDSEISNNNQQLVPFYSKHSHTKLNDSVILLSMNPKRNIRVLYAWNTG